MGGPARHAWVGGRMMGQQAREHGRLSPSPPSLPTHTATSATQSSRWMKGTAPQTPHMARTDIACRARMPDQEAGRLPLSSLSSAGKQAGRQAGEWWVAGWTGEWRPRMLICVIKLHVVLRKGCRKGEQMPGTPAGCRKQPGSPPSSTHAPPTQVEALQGRHAAPLCWHAALQLIGSQIQDAQAGQAAPVRRQPAAQLTAVEPQRKQRRHAAVVGWQGAGQWVEGEGEQDELAQCAPLWRQSAGCRGGSAGT